MEWLTAFQQSFREPVFAFLGAYWPVVAILILGTAGWFLSDSLRRGSSGGVDATLSDGDSDGGDDGGDGGGGGD